MTGLDNNTQSMIAEAERLGKAQEEIDRKNKKRRAKGRKPLPDLQESKDMQVLKRRYRTGDYTAIDGADAMKLYEMRKRDIEQDDDEDIDDQDPPEPMPAKDIAPESPSPALGTPDQDEAIRMAAAARRVEDMKNGRIDHVGNWTDGQKLDGGDKADLGSVPAKDAPPPADDVLDAPPEQNAKKPRKAKASDIEAFKADLYERLKVSFEALETTLSDLQGRVSEIVIASTPRQQEERDGMSEFEKWLSSKAPVVFDVGGTQMTFDAICVFHAPPCITIVSKIGSAKITPKPGAQLMLTYEMDGIRYERDRVTFLGTRFELPMFGLSFVGFIRDSESDMMDVDSDAVPAGD